MKPVLSFISVIYWKVVAIVCIIISRKFLIVLGGDLYAIRHGLTIEDAQRIAKYMGGLAEKRIKEINQDQAVSEVNKIIERK
jgi:hypothetical protein